VTQNKHRSAPAVVLILLALGATPARPDTPAALPDAGARYDDCMRLARAKPAEGLQRALAWGEHGGADRARHCAAVALLGLGNFAAAAARLEALAWSLPMESPESARVQLLSQAGQAWLDARQPGKAHAVLSAAVDLAPQDPDLRIDRAMALAAAQRYQDAILDLSAALIADPASVDALTLRASAYRLSGRRKAAAADIDRALALAPDNPDALLERGILRQLDGDRTGAARDWLRLVKDHADTPAASIARRNLKRAGMRRDGGGAQTR
jgi:tetratricopeptide (TPR) repeat protein